MRHLGVRLVVSVELPAAHTTLHAENDRDGLYTLRDPGLTVLVAGAYAAHWNAGSCCGRPQCEGVDGSRQVSPLLGIAPVR